MANLLHKSVEKIAEFSKTDDLGKLLNVTGTIGWAASCAAFTGAVALNDNIPKEQKKFLIPQEIADGVVNCSLFWVFTGRANVAAKKIIREGKIFPKMAKGAKDKVLKLRKEIVSDSAFMAKVEKKEASVTEALLQKLDAGADKGDKDIAKKVKGFSKAFPTLVSIAGSAVAMNLVTPFIRNDIASRIQSKYIQKTHDAPLQPSMPVRNIHKPPMTMNQYLVNSRGGGMKI